MAILLTQKGGIIGPIAKLMGWIMNLIFEGLNLIGIENIGLAIILFTIIIYMLMLPMQIKQQKFTRISAVMNPEIQAIQKKYKGKSDQASMIKMQDETKLVYEKYGTSPMGGCAGSLIQLPFLFALWPVVQNIPAYVGRLKNAYNAHKLVDKIMKTKDYADKLEKFIKANRIIPESTNFDAKNAEEAKNAIIDVLYKLNDGTWDKLAGKNYFPDLANVIQKTKEDIEGFTNFLTFSIAETPSDMLRTAVAQLKGDDVSNLVAIGGIAIALAIPLLAGATQFLSVKISQNANPSAPAKKQEEEENTMLRSMNMMTKVMPLMSVVFCYTMPTGLGLYWITSAVVRTIQQVCINKVINKQPIEELVKKNIEKAAKKRAGKGDVDPKKMNAITKKYTKKLDEIRAEADRQEKEAQAKKSNYTPSNSKPGSLSARANMVRDYNNRNNK